ncbi:hypothetical protein [Bacillus paranthracis]|uniref:hypothetical protein n=1 Tax=Bacillus paranthracis TaxID=2026186 RepID=UPI00220C62B9|nr:hypothetical protein [Bacillus paranthracis]UXR28843.1 hypothetical protein [Bacillus phage Nachito]
MGALKGFTLLRWNGKYGDEAIFVAKDNSNGKQTIFKPYSKDVAWTDKDLTQSDEAKGWEEFGNEKVDSLDDIVF